MQIYQAALVQLVWNVHVASMQSAATYKEASL
jgi:hypothetical protein